jgi:hypothetical protein
VDNPSNKPTCSAALKDELAALESLIEAARRIREQARPEGSERIEKVETSNDAKTNPGEE